jgi:serine/threonine protein kinase
LVNRMGIEVGQRIGDYEITGKLGAGGLGVVYEVRHLISQRAEAMKVLLPNQIGTAEMAERFRREVQLLATLNHANIAALHNAFYYNDQLIMVMELIHGETLRDRSGRMPIPLAIVLSYASQILSALAFAHQAGVVHRDIKPSNVMITEANIVKLLDFGIAISDRSTELTNPGFLVGSLNYMSPEQVSGGKATARSDIYSVAVTLYEVLTGRLPITGANNYEIMTGHMQRTPVAPAEINPGIPQVVSHAIMRALAKDPLERFANASDFNAALQAMPSGHGYGYDSVRASGSGRGTDTGAETIPIPSLIRPITSGMVQRPPSSGGMESLPLDTLIKQLAVFIGPVAKFVVKKLAAECSDMDQLWVRAAKQIPSEADRQKFLRSRVR